MRIAVVSSTLVLLTALAVQQPATWRLSARPTLQIGEVEGDSNYQFHRAISSVRLDDGRIAVMNAGSSQLRVYDARGRLIASKGRRGAGPGEFRAPQRIYRVGRDSVMVFDFGNQRFTVHGSDATLSRQTLLTEQTSGRFAFDEWLFNRSWIDGPAFGRGRALVRAAISRLPPVDTAAGFRFIRVSSQGHLWVRQSNAQSAPVPWLVYDLDGRPLARVVTPARFEIHEIGRDYVLGVGRDEMDVEFIQMYRLEGAERVASRSLTGLDTLRAPAAPKVPETALREMRALLRNMMSAQEIFYSDPKNDYTYASSIRQLSDILVAGSRLRIPPQLEPHIVRAGKLGWMAMITHKPTGASCGVVQGSPVPVGWTPGVVMCE